MRCTWSATRVRSIAVLTISKECIGFLKGIRFEELWLLFHLVLNEKKIILVSNNVDKLGGAM